MKKWSEMVDLDKDFNDRINRLTSNLTVSLLIYEKYQPIFKDLFTELLPAEPKKSKKTL